MIISHYQSSITPKDIDSNIQKVLDGLALADREGIDIMSFPESMLTGYYRSEALTRKYSLDINGSEINELLRKSSSFKATFICGFNEKRGREIYNSAFVAEQGRLLGVYSKAFPCFNFFSPGKEFLVFESKGLKFGVVICADGGYIEPSRILALKGADVIFAPHYNYIQKERLINHHEKVKSDHCARAVENSIYFFRGNSMVAGYDEGLDFDGVGYGESYLIDPFGEIVARGQRHVESVVIYRLNLENQGLWRSEESRSLLSYKALNDQLNEAIRSLE